MAACGKKSSLAAGWAITLACSADQSGSLDGSSGAP